MMCVEMFLLIVDTNLCGKKCTLVNWVETWNIPNLCTLIVHETSFLTVAKYLSFMCFKNIFAFIKCVCICLLQTINVRFHQICLKVRKYKKEYRITQIKSMKVELSNLMFIESIHFYLLTKKQTCFKRILKEDN